MHLCLYVSVCVRVCVRDRQTWVSRAGVLYSINVYVSLDFSAGSVLSRDTGVTGVAQKVGGRSAFC